MVSILVPLVIIACFLSESKDFFFPISFFFGSHSPDMEARLPVSGNRSFRKAPDFPEDFSRRDLNIAKKRCNVSAGTKTEENQS